VRTRGRWRNIGRGRLAWGGAPAWTPAQLSPAPALWLTAGPAYCFTDAAGTVPCGDGDLVRVWKDRSGNARDVSQGTSSKRPTLSLLSGKWAVLFDGVDDFLSGTVAMFNPSLSDLTAMAAARVPSFPGAGTNAVVLSQQDGGGTGRSWLEFATAGAYDSFLGGVATTGSTAATVNTWARLGVAKQGTTVAVSFNGVADGSATRTVESAAGATTVGSQKTGVSSFLSGRVAGVVVTGSLLGGADMALLNTYLASLTA
jgi:hypothetical protein